MRLLYGITLVLISFFLTTCATAGGGLGPGTCKIDTTRRTNQATWYTSNPAEVGSCSFPLNSTPTGTIGAAIAQEVFGGSQLCGTCYELVGSAATVTVQIADSCVGCPSTAIFDLLDSTLQTLTGKPPGIGTITYRQVNCPITGNIIIESDSGSNPYYLKARVLNHRTPIATMDLKIDGEYKSMMRSSDNAFDVSPDVRIPNPIELQITDTFGNILEESVTLSPGRRATGNGQFPICTEE